MEPFKNSFSPTLVSCIADQLEQHIASFDRANFEVPIHRALDDLELKARAQLIADHIHLALPRDHAERSRVLRAMLRDEYDEAQLSDEHGLAGWAVYPLTIVVGQHGIDDFEDSLELLKAMTGRFSSEFGIRYFLLADQDRALGIMRSWIDDPSKHVRRLVSEGTRPRLPWATHLTQLIADPSPMLPILKALRDDEEEYVRRSVSNHLNDIAKDHPDLVAELAADWMQGADKQRERLVRHACRTLIKQGHAAALKAFGLAEPKILLNSLTIESRAVELGGALTFSANVVSNSNRPQALVVDYQVYFKKSNGQLVGKVFKWKQVMLQPGEHLVLSRSHSIRPITTRRYYGGQQAVSLRINGCDFGYATFDLITSVVRHKRPFKR